MMAELAIEKLLSETYLKQNRKAVENWLIFFDQTSGVGRLWRMGVLKFSTYIKKGC